MYTVAELFSWISSWLLVMPRIVGLFLVLPFTTRTFLPGLARIALILSMSIIVVPLMVDQSAEIPQNWLDISVILVKEIFLGFVLGFIFSIPFWVMDSVGAVIDRQRGVMSGSIQSEFIEGESTILGKFLSFFTVVLLFSTGGFYILFETFLFSYQAWPISSFFPTVNLEMSFYFLSILDALMYSVMLVAGPVLIVIFLVDLGFGFLNRSVPQINVFILSLPVKGIASILILTFYITKIAEHLKELFTEYPASLHGLENLFR